MMEAQMKRTNLDWSEASIGYDSGYPVVHLRVFDPNNRQDGGRDITINIVKAERHVGPGMDTVEIELSDRASMLSAEAYSTLIECISRDYDEIAIEDWRRSPTRPSASSPRGRDTTQLEPARGSLDPVVAASLWQFANFLTFAALEARATRHGAAFAAPGEARMIVFMTDMKRGAR